MERTSARFDPDSLGDAERTRQFRRTTLMVTLCGMAFAAVIILLSRMVPVARDTDGAPEQTAAGKITRIHYAQEVDEYGSSFHLTTLEVDGKPLDARDALHEGELKEGLRVRYSYVVGKSGQWYLRAIASDSRR